MIKIKEKSKHQQPHPRRTAKQQQSYALPALSVSLSLSLSIPHSPSGLALKLATVDFVCLATSKWEFESVGERENSTGSVFNNNNNNKNKLQTPEQKRGDSEGGGSLQWSSRGQRTKTIKAATRHSWQHTQTHRQTHTTNKHTHTDSKKCKNRFGCHSRCDSCSKRSRHKLAKINVGRGRNSHNILRKISAKGT